LWKPPLPDTVSEGPRTALALVDRPHHQIHEPLDISSIPSGLVVVTGDSSAGHSTLLQRWAGALDHEQVCQLGDDPVTITHQILQWTPARGTLPRLITLDRLDRLCRGQSEAFRDWFIEELRGVAHILSDSPQPSHLVVTLAPHTPEARALTRPGATVIRLRQTHRSSYLDDHPAPPASTSPPGRIVVGGELAQVYLPPKPAPAVAELAEIPDVPDDALVVTDHEGEMTLAQAQERFFDVERAYRLRRLVLVGLAGESLGALRLPPVPPSTPPQGWLLGPGYVSLVNCEGLGTSQNRVDRDRVDS
jgi:energy-coupling factor transporter ATP-binding protein EcfA2